MSPRWGWYLDGVLQGTWLDNVKGYTPLTGMTVSGSAFAASLEGGYPYHFAPSWTLEPQAQLIYQYVDIGSGTDLFGADQLRQHRRRPGTDRGETLLCEPSAASTPPPSRSRSGAASISGTTS